MLDSCREIIEAIYGDLVIGRGGIVVEACNPKATAQALAAILLDDEMRADMGRVMQQRIPNLYHQDRIRRLYEELYAGLAPQEPVEADQISAGEVTSPKSHFRKVSQPWVLRSRNYRGDSPRRGLCDLNFQAAGILFLRAMSDGMRIAAAWIVSKRRG